MYLGSQWVWGLVRENEHSVEDLGSWHHFPFVNCVSRNLLVFFKSKACLSNPCEFRDPIRRNTCIGPVSSIAKEPHEKSGQVTEELLLTQHVVCETGLITAYSL